MMASHMTAAKPREAAEYCPVCYDAFYEEETDIEAPPDRGTSSASSKVTLPCRHVYCRPCLIEYTQLCVIQRRIPIACPSVGNSDSCETYLSSSLVRNLLQDEEWLKFQQRLRLVQDPSLVACPSCDSLVEAPELTLSDPHQRICGSCAHVFCALHGNVHLGMSCDDYARTAQAQQVAQTEAALRKYTKPCSHCGVHLHKQGGCDHVICVACHADMCFKCGTHVHLHGKVVRTCSKCRQGYIDHRYDRQYRLRTCLTLPFALPGYLLYVAIMTVVSLVTFGFCCCFFCGTEIDDDDAMNDRRLRYDPAARHRRPLEPWRGLRMGLAIVFLPLLMVAHDFGLPCPALDELFHDRQQQQQQQMQQYPPIEEIPTLAIDETVSVDASEPSV